MKKIAIVTMMLSVGYFLSNQKIEQSNISIIEVVNSGNIDDITTFNPQQLPNATTIVVIKDNKTLNVNVNADVCRVVFETANTTLNYPTVGITLNTHCL